MSTYYLIIKHNGNENLYYNNDQYKNTLFI